MNLDLLLKLLPILMSVTTELYQLIAKITEVLKQDAELTPEQEAAFDAHIKELESKSWWTPDA